MHLKKTPHNSSMPTSQQFLHFYLTGNSYLSLSRVDISTMRRLCSYNQKFYTKQIWQRETPVDSPRDGDFTRTKAGGGGRSSRLGEQKSALRDPSATGTHAINRDKARKNVAYLRLSQGAPVYICQRRYVETQDATNLVFRFDWN